MSCGALTVPNDQPWTVTGIRFWKDAGKGSPLDVASVEAFMRRNVPGSPRIEVNTTTPVDNECAIEMDLTAMQAIPVGDYTLCIKFTDGAGDVRQARTLIKIVAGV